MFARRDHERAGRAAFARQAIEYKKVMCDRSGGASALSTEIGGHSVGCTCWSALASRSEARTAGRTSQRSPPLVTWVDSRDRDSRDVGASDFRPRYPPRSGAHSQGGSRGSSWASRSRGTRARAPCLGAGRTPRTRSRRGGRGSVGSGPEAGESPRGLGRYDNGVTMTTGSALPRTEDRGASPSQR